MPPKILFILTMFLNIICTAQSQPEKKSLMQMYFAELDTETGDLVRLEMVPMEIERLSLHRASEEDALWLQEVLDRESRKFGMDIEFKNKILKADF